MSKIFSRRVSPLLMRTLVISLGLHLCVLLSPVLSWHRPLPPPMPMKAALKTMPQSPQKPPKAPTREKKPLRDPNIPAPQEPLPPDAHQEAAEEPEETAADETKENNAGDNGESAATIDGDMFFPPRGELDYTVYYGEKKFEIGKAWQRWEINKEGYFFSSVMETSGLAAVFYPARLETESRGIWGARGFQPLHYRVINSKTGEENVEFDWEKRQIRTSKTPPEILQPGSQDLLSLQYQFAYTVYSVSASVGQQSNLYIWVATGKKYENIRFDILGTETLEVPAGEMYALHLQSYGGSSQIDLWLALDYLMLPVKLRFVDKKGDIYEQVLRSISVEFPEEGAENAKEGKTPETP